MYYVVAFGVANTGLTLNGSSFTTFKKVADGAAPTNAAPSSFVELGGGMYSFQYTAAEDVAFVVDGGGGIPSAIDRYARGILSPADNVAADVNKLAGYLAGRWKIHTTGADANRIVFYAEDGTTVVAKFDLKDINGDPTYNAAFERVPV